MPKDIPQPVNPPSGRHTERGHGPNNEPLSGSKKIKNQNHSRQNNGEG